MLSLLIKRHSQAAAVTLLSLVLFCSISSSFLWMYLFPSPRWSVISYPSVLSYRPHIYRQWEHQNAKLAVGKCVCAKLSQRQLCCLKEAQEHHVQTFYHYAEKRHCWYLCMRDLDSKTHLLLRVASKLQCSCFLLLPAHCPITVEKSRAGHSQGEISVQGRKR